MAKKNVFVLRTPEQKAQAVEFISKIQPDPDDPMMLVISVYEEKRTELQNRYLWGWLYLNIAVQLEDAGIVITSDDLLEYPYDKDLLHAIFQEKFLCYATIKRGSKERKLCYSTTCLLKSPKEGEEARCFSTYVDNIKRFVYQMWEIHIPPTNSEEMMMLEMEMSETNKINAKSPADQTVDEWQYDYATAGPQ